MAASVSGSFRDRPPATHRNQGEHIAGIYENARVNGKSLSHLRHLRSTLRSRFNVAIEEDLIQQSPWPRSAPKGEDRRRERAVLTDMELFIYLSWTHPLEHRRFAVIERQAMSALARMFGGLRTGDVHALNWEHLDTRPPTGLYRRVFAWGMALRKKTARPQRIAVPEGLRPILQDWWARTGKKTMGPVFPLLRGKDAGVGPRKRSAMRRDCDVTYRRHSWPTGSQYQCAGGRPRRDSAEARFSSMA